MTPTSAMIKPLLPPDGMAAGTAAGDGAVATPGGRDAPGAAAAAARAIVADNDAAEGAPAVGRGAPTEAALGDAVDEADGGETLLAAGSARVAPHCTQNLAPGWVS